MKPFNECPDSVSGHGLTDVRGRCPYCKRKIAAASAPPPSVRMAPSELTDAYGEFYDPDHGALDPESIRRRYQMGQDL